MSTIGQPERATQTVTYTIEAHNHRLAAWAAATAASASKLCRFKVTVGAGVLEGCGFGPAFCSPAQLPSPHELDQKHEEWRVAIIKAAANQGLDFTHGVAAKLINCYLKVRFICGGHHEHERVRCLHPPIDEVLLLARARQNVGGFRKEWRKFRHHRWSKFDSATYQAVIDHVRKSLPPGEALWQIEEYWEGHQ